MSTARVWMLVLVAALVGVTLMAVSMLRGSSGAGRPATSDEDLPVTTHAPASPAVNTRPPSAAATIAVDAAVVAAAVGTAVATPSSADGAAEMSEGLAQDLAMFNSEQLRAELESIALSYSTVTVGTAICAARPCRAEASSSDGDQLNQFVEMVVNRFQGHVKTDLQTRRTPAGISVVQASFIIGAR